MDSKQGDSMLSNEDGTLYFKAELPADGTSRPFLKEGGEVVELPDNDREIELPGDERDLVHELAVHNSR